MPVPVSVKDVRARLLQAAGQAGDSRGDGEPGTLLLGSIFHAVFADAVSPDPERSGVRVVLESGRDPEVAARRLTAHLYDALLGPRLSRHQAQLHDTTSQVLSLWTAVQHLGTWLAGLVLEATRAEPGTPSWEAIARRFSAEESLSCELNQPGWKDSVVLTGAVDSLIRRADDQWCALELKLGQALPVVDLGQAALYRLIASRQQGSRGALALVRFAPAPTEVLVSAEQVAEAEQKLIALIGAIAGVVRPEVQRTEVVPPPKPRPAYGELAQAIIRAYREYGPVIDLPEPPTMGPRFLRYAVRLGRGVTITQVARLTPEVGIRAGLGTEPLVTREGGGLALDVARPDPETVPFSVVRTHLGGRAGSALLPIGVNPGLELVCADLSSPNHAHVLVAGSAGSGKSEWLRMAIAGLMISNTPDTLRLVLIDPKMSAFMDLRRSRWLLGPESFWVPGEGQDIITLLDGLVEEMERRYALMGKVRADDLVAYRALSGTTIPRVAVFCDEYFALISGDKKERKEVETRIALLAAKGRASGIHLIVATQQASREVIKGTLDANMSCRVGLRMPKAIESRLLLGEAGAERLTGNGDLLYKAIGDPVRLQAPYLTSEERGRLFQA